MYAKFSNLIEVKELRKHHHINLDKEFKEDCIMWRKFLQPDNIMSVCRPFIDVSDKKGAKENFFYSDASGSLKKGAFGAVFVDRWICAPWSKTFLQDNNPSIEYLELAALVIAVFTWIDLLANLRVRIFCDNNSVVNMIESTSSNCKRCMRLIRILTLKCLNFNTRIFAKHVKSEDNEIADALSRGQWSRFRRLAKQHKLQRVPDLLTKEVWPIEKIWNLDN